MVFSQIKSLDIKLRVGIIFGLCSLIISIVLGLISGNAVATILFRSVILTIVFIFLGYALILVLEKFVPEFNTVLNREAGEPGVDPGSDDVEEYDSAETGEAESGISDTAAGEAENYESMEGADSPGFGSSGAAATEIGKHFIVGENKIKYEPKIMADAVRTMLKKDDNT